MQSRGFEQIKNKQVMRERLHLGSLNDAKEIVILDYCVDNPDVNSEASML